MAELAALHIVSHLVVETHEQTTPKLCNLSLFKVVSETVNVFDFLSCTLLPRKQQVGRLLLTLSRDIVSS